MSRIEALRAAHSAPGDLRRFKVRRWGLFGLYKAFVGKHIDSHTHEQRASVFESQSPPQVTIDHPGPIYGLLVAAGFSAEHARNIADEEGAHYREAVAQGMKPYITIRVLASLDSNGAPVNDQRELVVEVEWSLPIDSPEEALRIREAIARAPEQMSPFDEAISR